MKTIPDHPTLAIKWLRLNNQSKKHLRKVPADIYPVRHPTLDENLENNQYVQFGSGMSAPKGWRNFDSSPTLRFERLPVLGKLYSKNNHRFPENVEYGDIVKGLPVKNTSCKAVYCSHVLEHLSLEDFRLAIRNTYTILQKDGIFRLVVPDLEYAIKNYIDDSSLFAAFNFMKEISLGKERRNRGLSAFIQEWLGNSQHYWAWDYKSLKYELVDAGFKEIRRAKLSDSPDPMFKKVEEKGRWKNCLGIECRK